VEEQVVSIYAGTKGYLDEIPTSDVGRFESELLEEFNSRYSDLMNEIKESGKMPDDDKMKSAMEGFRDRFQPTETGPSDADKKAEEAKKSDDDDDEKSDDDDKRSGDDEKSGEAKKSDDDEKSGDDEKSDETAEMDTKAEDN